jgi:MEKHLA domain
MMLQHGQFLLTSYKALTGKELLPGAGGDDKEASRRLFLSHERVVVSHGTQKDLPDGPILNYGNTAALRRWGASWEQLTSMPSKFTAGPMEREVREAFMRQVTEKGIVQDYTGIRVALDGTQFQIKEATVWNIVVNGAYLGQAATFPLLPFPLLQ